MNFTDTHAHLYLSAFNNDIHTVIANAIKNKITKIILPNIDSNSLSKMLELCEKYPDNCFPAIGLHPTSVNKNFETELKLIEKHLQENQYCAIGETGIDLYWDKTFLKQQIQAFEYQIELSKKTNLPLIIHARESFKEIFEILDKTKDKNIKGVFHCFTGNIQEAEKAIALGFKLGIGGVVTYKNSKLSTVLKEINIKNIVIETDAPFLSPVPKRGKRNEPAHIIYIAEKLSEIYNENIENIAKITNNNANEIFKIP